MNSRLAVIAVALGAGLMPLSAAAELSPTAAERVALRRLGKVKRCYANTLKVRPEKFGVITVRLVVGTDGRTKSTDVTLSSLNDRELESCIRKAFAGLAFPSPGEDDHDVSFSLLLKTDETPEELIKGAEGALRPGPPPIPQ